MKYRWSPRNVTSMLVAVCVPALIIYFYVGAWAIVGIVPVIVLTVIVLASAVWWVLEAVWEHRHRGDMQAFADHVGWEYVSRTPQFRFRFRSYPFGQGTDREDVDVLRGTFRGYQCATFTRRYDMGSDDSRAILNFQITLVELPVKLPTVDILPDGGFAKLGKVLGGSDIDFESAEFNRLWHVKSNDERYAHALVHPRMMERLIKSDAVGRAIRFEERAVMMWSAERLGTEDLSRRIGVLTALAALVPPHLEREFRELEAQEEQVALQLRATQEEAWNNAPLWATTPGALTQRKYTGLHGDKSLPPDFGLSGD